MSPKSFARCACYLLENVFVREAEAHVALRSEEELRAQLASLGLSGARLRSSIDGVHKEVERRAALIANAAQRKRHVAALYRPLHPGLASASVSQSLVSSLLDPRFLSAWEAFRDSGDFKQWEILDGSQGIKSFHFPFLTADACRLIREEAEHFNASDVPKQAPNSMNRQGVSMSDAGLDDLIRRLREDWLTPLGRAFFRRWTGDGLDSDYAFTVGYCEAGDRRLGWHFDNAELSLNIALSPQEDFDGGELVFAGLHGEPRAEEVCSLPIGHREGWAILHCGRQRHAALPITRGRRTNLIVWCRSSSVRAGQCPMCGRPPQLTPPTHQGDQGDGFAWTQPNGCALS